MSGVRSRRLPPARVALLIVVARVASAAAQPATAGPTPGAATNTLAVEATEIAVVGSPANLDWVRALLRPDGSGGGPLHWSRMDHFDPRDVLRATAGARGAIRCWVDLTDAKRARIYFAARSGERFLIRDLDLSGAFDELDRATLAEVLDLSLLALIEDDRAGLSRAETETLLARRTAATAAVVASMTPAPVNAPPSPPPPPLSPGPRVGVFYAGQGFSTELPIVQGPGLFLAWSFRGAGGGRGQLGAWLSVQYQLPADDQQSLVGLRLQSVAPRAGIQIRLLRDLDARLGLGADLSHLTPVPGTAGSTATLTPPRWSTGLLMTAAVGASVALTRRVEIEALVFADYVPTAVDYDLVAGGQSTTAVSSFRLRPGIALELTVR